MLLQFFFLKPLILWAWRGFVTLLLHTNTWSLILYCNLVHRARNMLKSFREALKALMSRETETFYQSVIFYEYYSNVVLPQINGKKHRLSARNVIIENRLFIRYEQMLIYLSSLHLLQRIIKIAWLWEIAVPLPSPI